MQKIKQIMGRLGGVDPYDMLQTSPSQDFLTLKKNYRQLALRYHPDRNKQQHAKQQFIKINLAYEFLQQQQHRQIYQNHLKALQQQKQRQSKMSDDRKRMLQQLRRRQEEFNQRRKDMAEQLKRRKQFFEKKMKQQEQRQKLREEILSEMKPNQYYQQLTSIKVQWQKGLSFSKMMLQQAFNQYDKVTNVRVEAKARQAIVTFSSIDVCTNIVKVFTNPQIKIDYMVEKTKRDKMLKAMKMEKVSGRTVDFSLTSQNLARLKEVVNRGSGLYVDSMAKRMEEM